MESAREGMLEERPVDVGAYKDWLKAFVGPEAAALETAYYEAVATRIRETVAKGPVWTDLVGTLGSFESEYLAATGYRLFVTGVVPELQVKPFDSFILKTFRKNVIENGGWPSPPEGGWYVPTNWYARIRDVVRTLTVVKYLDGVEFVANRIEALCHRHSAVCSVEYEAREEGYYAAHIYISAKCEIPKVTWDTETIDVMFEVQVTTQLQEVIRRLLHRYYEARRSRLSIVDTKWQWDYRNDEFIANYLGHILHYVEGMIMDVRDKQREAME